MYGLQEVLLNTTKKAIQDLYGEAISEKQIQFQDTRPDFEGEITLVVFPLLRISKKKPEDTAQEIGDYLTREIEQLKGFEVEKGFLNLSVSDAHWLQLFKGSILVEDFGVFKAVNKTVLVEYSSPNTNKPLHLGHLRNNFLGHSVARILEAVGNTVKKVQIINDRGIHICKSMVAWQKFGNGETPETSKIKGDHLVGKYYVAFDKAYKKEIQELVSNGISEEQAKKEAPIFLEAQETLRKWENGDVETVALWKKMNAWVYSGFDSTYETMGIDFDKLYYESETYLKGKEVVLDALSKELFYKKEDGSVWIDLEKEKLDQKLLLRSDGTAVYMTQDVGTAILRKEDFPDMTQMVYTVGNEQDYHFKVLFKILEKLGYDWAANCYHLSYGMVDLPSGKMKSREGTVVDADDLMQEMFETAAEKATELGKLEGLNEQEKKELYRIIGLAALKYFILKVDPKKRMLFDPNESVDFNGNTGPFIQYAYARIQALKRRAEKENIATSFPAGLHEKEKELIKLLSKFPEVMQEAANAFSPAVIANYTYDLVKVFNQFYQNVSIFSASDEEQALRISLADKTGEVIKKSMFLLGAEVPNRM